MISHTLNQVSQTMQTVLNETADNLARTTGFIKRRVKVTGANFTQTLVFGWMSNPSATLEELTQTGAAVGLEITPQGLDQRFTEQGANFMEEMLEETVSQVITSDPVAIQILRRFNGVHIQDSSTISLPHSLSNEWSGCGDGISAIKMEVRLDMLTGALDGPFLVDGRTNLRFALLENSKSPVNYLSIANLGYLELSN